LALATATLVGAASCAGGNGMQPAGQVGTAGAHTLSTRPPLGTAPAGGALSPLAARLAPYLEHHFGDSYTGVLVDSAEGRLIVYRRPDPALDAAARGIAGSAALSFVDARFSLAQQHRLVSRIQADRGWWQRHGVNILGVSTSNGVHCAALVDIAEHPSTAQRAFDAHYGAGAARLSRRAPVQPVGSTQR
jgi:hypothetical protein